MGNKIEQITAAHGYKNRTENPEILSSHYETATFKWCFKNTKLNVKEASFFEIGAGSGNFFYFLNQNGVKNYLGCEIGEQPIAQFNRLFPSHKDLLLKGDVLSVLESLGNKKLDCVIAWNVVEHLNDDDLIALFEVAAKKLTPGGEFWIFTPCAESIIFPYNRYIDLTHKRSFTVKNFRILSEVFGLEILAKSGRIVAVQKHERRVAIPS